MSLFAGLAFCATAGNGWEISGVTAVQHWPFDRSVDIDFIARQTDGANSQLRAARLEVSVAGRVIPAGELAQTWILGEGRRRLVWTPAATGYPMEIENASFEIAVLEDVQDVGYMTVDLESGKLAYKPMSFSNEVNTELYKTTSMAFRYIPSTYSARWRGLSGKSSFRIGSDGKRTDIGIIAADRDREGTANITLTRGFFLGVFPMTRKQFSLLGGTTSSPLDSVPIRNVTYDYLRGPDGTNSVDGADANYCYPIRTAVRGSSIIGQLRSRTGLPFDFPSEAQWEYAARAGSEGEYFFAESGNLLSQLNQYGANDPNASVGSKQPNAWGLYDLIGCCHQWTTTCGRLTTDSSDVGIKHYDATDPTGATPTMGSGPYRVCKGSHCNTGGWDTQKRVQRCAYRMFQRSNCVNGEQNNSGCRLSLTLDID